MRNQEDTEFRSSGVPKCKGKIQVQGFPNSGVLKHVLNAFHSGTFPIWNFGILISFCALLFSCDKLSATDPDALTANGYSWVDKPGTSAGESSGLSSSAGSSTTVHASSSSVATSSSVTTFTYAGQTYRTVTIGSQIWMAENLNYVPSTGNSWCNGDLPSNCTTYGRLYDFATAKTVCPTGWHLPDTTEWNTLKTFAGGANMSGSKLKSVSSLWTTNTGNTDNYGFSALPGGYHQANSPYANNVGYNGDWWTSTNFSSQYGYFNEMTSGSSSIALKKSLDITWDTVGLSVRCINDQVVVISSSSALTSSSSRSVSSSIAPSSSQASSSSVLASSSSMIASSSSVASSSSIAIQKGQFTDSRDGQVYDSVRIGTQTWMAENLAYLPSVNAQADSSTAVAKYYVYGYDGTVVSTAKAQANFTTYGALYNYQAAKTACPSGWHLPDTTEWNTLEAAVGGTATAGTILKASSALWVTNTGSDAYGFSALPGGYYYGSSFSGVGYSGYWWTAAANGSSNAYDRYMNYNSANVNYNYNRQTYGFSVRCLKGNATASSSSVATSSSSVVPSSSSVASSSSITIQKGQFTDSRDGQVYDSVRIGTQTWMAKNLAYLPSVNAQADSSTAVAKYYVYGYNGTVVGTAKAQANYTTYGALYNYQAAKTACPSGWHLPDTTEWNTLEAAVGGTNTAGTMLKANSALWVTNTGTDAYVFSALPGGYYGTAFGNVGNYGNWWTATAYGSTIAYFRDMYYDSATVGLSKSTQTGGFSVRCLKDP